MPTRTTVVAVPLALLLVLVSILLTRGDQDREEIHPQMLAAYVGAVEQLPEVAPQCTGLTWPVLAGIGQVESGHARGSQIDGDGYTDPAIVGPRLDGSGAGGNTTPIYDTDGGRWDDDGEYDRAVGPMQFIPTSWELYGRQAAGAREVDETGLGDPHNVRDAALAAAVHLCGFTPTDLSDPAQRRQAVLRYNQSERYADEVLGWAEQYAEQYGDEVPAGQG